MSDVWSCFQTERNRLMACNEREDSEMWSMRISFHPTILLVWNNSIGVKMKHTPCFAS